MTDQLPADLAERPPTAEDHPRVLATLDEWWGGFGGAEGSRERALLLPRLFFQHFTDTSTVVERADGALAAFLVGFLSQSQPGVAYVHFVGVAPNARRAGLGAWLYERFFRAASHRGAIEVRCITSPGNAASIAFHRRLGFEVTTGDAVVGGVPVQRNYDGPGLDRVAFSRRLTRTTAS